MGNQRNLKRIRKAARKESAAIISEFVRSTYKLKFRERVRIALALLFRRRK